MLSISKENLIEEIHNYFAKLILDDPSDIIDPKLLKMNKEICNIIHEQPEETIWIPCNERPPKELERCIVTV